jgi:hypothetical protein
MVGGYSLEYLVSGMMWCGVLLLLLWMYCFLPEAQLIRDWQQLILMVILAVGQKRYEWHFQSHCN